MKRLAGILSAAALVITVGCAQTDPGITSSVKAKFAADDVVKASDINVDTMDHIVTLSGVVDNAAVKERAVQIASTTNGVRDVVDRMTISDTAATSGQRDLNLGDDLKRGGEVLKEGAEETGKAIKNGAERVGDKVTDAVTDKDHDSDKDGK
jgi:hypothetical protein